MLVPRKIPLLLLILSVVTVSRCDSKEEKNGGGESSKESLSGQESFSKKQGQFGNVPDQIAMESHYDSLHAQHKGERNPFPLPFPMKGISGSVVLPMPPGFNSAGHGPPIGIRLPGPGQHLGPQGQHSSPHHQFIPHSSGELKFQKSKEIFSGPPPLHHHQTHHQHHDNVKHQIPQQFHQVHSSELGFHPHHKLRVPPSSATHPKIMVPPKPSSYVGPDAQLANTVFRELFDKQQQKLKHHGGQRPVEGHKPVVGNDLVAQGGQYGSPVVEQFGPPPPVGGPEGPPPPSGTPWPQGPDSDMPKIVTLEVKCEKSVMRVYVAFDKPFFGVIFSKGHYHNVHCIHLPAGLGHTSANFDISIDSCGTQGNTENGLYGYGVQSGSGSFFENIIVIQYDPQVQEVWDQARKLRCTWHDQYEKSVTFRPFPVDMLDVVRADFAGDNVGCWMQIQVGKGPWASEVSGLVKIGQSMTMVLAIKDDDTKFDMLVRNCMAHDGVRAPVQLVDQWGCVTRPKLMSRFTKIKNFGQSASVLSYAHFQAFKFPDSMEVHFQCTIQICRYQCPEQCSQPADGGVGAVGGYGGHIGKTGLLAEREEARRRRRSVSNETEDEVIEFSTTLKIPTDVEEDVGLNKVITVVSEGDLDFISGDRSETSELPLVEVTEFPSDIVCMSTFGFVTMLIILIGTLLIACIFSAVIVLKRPKRKY